MDAEIAILRHIYARFNARDIDSVLAALADDVAWANGMEGGHVHGREAVRDYWTRQWALVRPQVEPVSFRPAPDGAIVAEVRQSVRDLDGRPIAGEAHGLETRTVGHAFRFRDGKVVRFDIEGAAEPVDRDDAGRPPLPLGRGGTRK